VEVAMKQTTLTGFEKYGKTTRRAQFLADMDKIIPWEELAAAVQTAYPKVSESGGRPPIPLERMLRIYFLQLWFNLSDPAVEGRHQDRQGHDRGRDDYWRAEFDEEPGRQTRSGNASDGKGPAMVLRNEGARRRR
jgi:hypothetical protein